MTRSAYPPPSASRAEVDAWCRDHGFGQLEPACARCGAAPVPALDPLCEPCATARSEEP